MSVKNDLVDILGKEAVLDDEETRAQYSCDQSLVQSRTPDVIAYAETVTQVQDIVRYANKSCTPIVPFSSGLNLHGAAIPRQGGILLNLSRMNKILTIDDDNWFVVIEPGVTFQQLQDELNRYQLRAMLPFGAPPPRSALTSWVERDPALASASFEYGNDLLMDTEIVLPDGELFKTGLWSAGGKPGSHMGPVRSMLYRFWTAAQGTMGIITKACFKVEHLPAARKIIAFSFSSLEDVMGPMYEIQRKEIGLECFALNRFNLASMFCKEWQVPDTFPAQAVESRQFETLRKELPPWAMIICLNGGPELPEEKIAYEEEALQEIGSRLGLSAYSLNGNEQLLLDDMLRPWNILKKFCYRGSIHDVAFKSPLKRVTEMERIVSSAAEKQGYPEDDIGAYILPIERGRAVHCEFDFHCAPAEKETVRTLWLETSEKLIDEGAFFDRPYGAWAEMMYSRTGEYTHKLKELKAELDPNSILNPGHLCF